jgi:hypothetical protein
MRTNFFGSVYPAYYALPYLREAKGHIAVTSSVVSKLIVFGMVLFYFLLSLRRDSRRKCISLIIKNNENFLSRSYFTWEGHLDHSRVSEHFFYL